MDDKDGVGRDIIGQNIRRQHRTNLLASADAKKLSAISEAASN